MTGHRTDLDPESTRATDVQQAPFGRVSLVRLDVPAAGHLGVQEVECSTGTHDLLGEGEPCCICRAVV